MLAALFFISGEINLSEDKREDAKSFSEFVFYTERSLLFELF